MYADVDHVIEAAKVLEKHPESAVTVAPVKKLAKIKTNIKYKSPKNLQKVPPLSHLQLTIKSWVSG